ncbi:MAG: phosphoribosylamine--glycine ligase, partial [Eubacteriales bacterium]|nr:phosphoribosylamine--glycine ligase [Eubacteriales bacterium]
MRVLVIGGGGREHALIKALKKSREITALYALPGNGGIAAEAVCVGIPVTDTDAVIAYIKAEQIGFVVVAPDDPLAAGMVNALHAAGIPCFGPEKAAAAIESSKVFAKELMQKYNIPTAKYQVFCFSKDALSYVEQCDYPVVIKADGLALGKGVVIASTQEEAKAAINEIMVERKFGESGSRIVIEECLTGPEVSVLTFTDGHCIKPMVSSMDHKRAQDNDLGPNTGGMGTVAPNPYYTKDIAARCMEEILLPTMRAMNAEGAPFKGCLYFGLMLTKDGPKVIEYNCRFGDPETQVVLPLLESDLFRVMRAVEEERLSDVEVVNKPGAACCVIVASAG